MKDAATILVIPGRTQRVRPKAGPMTGSGANPESSTKYHICVWIPGSPLRGAPE
jgi:hypothetical protein